MMEDGLRRKNEDGRRNKKMGKGTRNKIDGRRKQGAKLMEEEGR